MTTALPELVDRFRAGESVLRISGELGVSRWSVQQQLRDAGLEPRGRTEAARLRHGIEARGLPVYTLAAERGLNRKALAEAIVAKRVRRTLPELDEDLASLPRCEGCDGPALRADGTCGSCGAGRKRPRTPTGTTALHRAAEILGVNRRTLRRVVAAGLIPAESTMRAGTGNRYRFCLPLGPLPHCGCGDLAVTHVGLCAHCATQTAIDQALRRAGLVAIKRAATEFAYLTPEALAWRGRGIARVEIGGIVRLGVDAREVFRIAPDKHHARSKLAPLLAVLNGTDRIGRPPALSDAEIEIAQRRRVDGVGWRTIANELSASRTKPVSHMAVKRALERATAQV